MTQKQALEIMLTRENIFLTGAPGAGKTYLLNQFIEECECIGRRIAITASTGIAASHIGGTTIHSWSGLGIADELTKDDLRRYENNKQVRKRYNKTDVLVIDEISMLHGFRLDMINRLAKHLRKNEQPFGGMQVILVGDLFQLPPVTRNSSVFDFVYLSQSWRELDLRICYLTEQHRQDADDALLELLQAMRSGAINEQHRNVLQVRAFTKAGDDITRLYSHNVDVDEINQEHLDALPGKVKRYTMSKTGNKYQIDKLARNILAPEVLELKVGAEVMFVANNRNEGYYNGMRGIVKKFSKSGDPIVKMKASKRTLMVERHSWKMKQDEVVLAEVEQTPLRLAWAITIHKSQGMSLDSAEVDLSKAFTPGMGYVALSRVRSLDGLYLQGINEMALTMHPGIYDFDLELRKLSEALL